MDNDNYLMISGIQHFCFCPRQWALIHIEQQWIDNALTCSGTINHSRVHNASSLYAKHDNFFVIPSLRVTSDELKMVGICDLVEFHKDLQGVHINKHDGKWNIIPVEYKHGAKGIFADKMQLCAQSIALEESFGCNIQFGILYHISTKQREKVILDKKLRNECKSISNKMHELFNTGNTPKSNYSKSCNSCSLKDICLPTIQNDDLADDYIRKVIYEENA